MEHSGYWAQRAIDEQEIVYGFRNFLSGMLPSPARTPRFTPSFPDGPHLCRAPDKHKYNHTAGT